MSDLRCLKTGLRIPALPSSPAAAADYAFIYDVFRDDFRPHVERTWG